MVFWSGVDEAAARDFAKTVGRNTLEMLIGDRWAEFQKHMAKGGSRWHSWNEAVAGFWDLAAAACADFATGEVYVYMTREAMIEQTDPVCEKCWYREEKPRLIRGLNDGRISRIVKYVAPWRVGEPSIGKITTMNE